MRGMVINMEEAKLQTLVQIKAFLEGTTEVAFRIPKAERNQFIERVFKRFGYARHGRVDKGVLLRYLERMTGLSRQQVTRLVRQYRKEGRLAKPRQRIAPTNGFTCRYTLADMALLAEMDVLHSTLSGPATKKLMERAHQVFGDVCVFHPKPATCSSRNTPPIPMQTHHLKRLKPATILLDDA